jgi:hypothetical protein
LAERENFNSFWADEDATYDSFKLQVRLSGNIFADRLYSAVKGNASFGNTSGAEP